MITMTEKTPNTHPDAVIVQGYNCVDCGREIGQGPAVPVHEEMLTTERHYRCMECQFQVDAEKLAVIRAQTALWECDGCGTLLGYTSRRAVVIGPDGDDKTLCRNCAGLGSSNSVLIQ